MLCRTGDILQDYNFTDKESASETVNNSIFDFRHSTMHTDRMKDKQTLENQSK
ncbi:MAG: hypothetical protein PHV07_06545 [Oscillospiraceae bacterium]|nr:hypothetical protein [Oscillospiraceae bacterium]